MKKLTITTIFSFTLLFSVTYLVADDQDTFSLNVMSYNIQQMGFPGWFDNHFEKKRLEKLPERILEMENFPDVIIFQEVFLPSAHAYIKKSLSKEYPFATQIGGEGCGLKDWSQIAVNCLEQNIRYKLTHNSGVFILSRWPIEQSYSLSFQNYRVSYTFDFMARKGAVYARINKQGKVFHIAGTHLQADAMSHDVRMAQLEEIKNWLDSFQINKAEPVILAGDFNVSSKQKSQFDDMLSKSNTWVDFLETKLTSVSSLTNKYLALIYGAVEEKTLDYILYRVDHLPPKNSESLKVLNFKSKTPWLAERFFSDDQQIYDISDHYPVVARFEF
jgi:phospholipase C